MKGLILINAYAQMPELLSQAERLREEFEKRGVTAQVRRNDFFAVTVSGTLECGIAGYDFCVYLDKDKYILQGLEKAGIPLFNGYAAIEVCDDKMTTYLALANEGINMPLTLAGIFCYDKDAEISEQSLDKIEAALGYPLVIKECYGSRGTGVYLINNREELKRKSNELMLVPHLYQKYIKTSHGKDVRVIVIGGKAFGAILRQSKGDFRSNVALGGSASEFPLTPELTALCEKVASLLGLDYCGIDLLFDNESFVVCEVNSNAFFSGFERATGKNVAGAYADYILSVMKEKGCV